MMFVTGSFSIMYFYTLEKVVVIHNYVETLILFY